MNLFDINVIPLDEDKKNDSNKRNENDKEKSKTIIVNRFQDSYQGSYLHYSLHGYGEYIWTINQMKYIYEGQFYSNDLEGYGLLSYPNGDTFEGLFKKNKRYGPGIYSYMDGTKDIGMWMENRLIRLCIASEDIPKLTRSAQGKAYIIQFKNLIPIKELDDETRQYNKCIRNPESYFFNIKLHDDLYYEDIFPCESKNLVAWNNSEVCTSLMEHCFLHNDSEKYFTYKLVYILNGEYDQFRSISGIQEQACRNLLSACSVGNDTLVRYLIRNHDLNPDVTDSLGNNPVMHAACYDHVNVIKTLQYFGSDFNYVNDECLTPLNICLLRLIAIKYDVQNWEKAFILFPNMEEQQKEKYIFDLNCTFANYKDRTMKEDSMTVFLMNAIKKTISTLLNYGADVNYGIVPFPPLIIALFTNDPEIILQLIQNKAHINVIVGEEKLSPLHIVASLPISYDLITLARLLIENEADIDYRCDTKHWPEEKELLLVETEVEDKGKTPLHLLCLRRDFQMDTQDCLGELAEVLLKAGADAYAQYLGHSPLSLAIVKNNYKMIQHLLNFSINPNHALGNNMGVPLTVLTLNKYKKLYSKSDIKNIYDLLLKYNANPFYSVPNYDGNAVDFVVNSTENESKGKKKFEDFPLECLKNVAKCILLRHIQGRAIKYLYNYKIKCGIRDSIFELMCSFLSFEDSINVIQNLINGNKLGKVRKSLIIDLLKYIASKTSYKTNKPIEDIVKEQLNFKVNLSDDSDITLSPEADDNEEIYKVCFECYQRLDKELYACPYCQLVYFCSEECNKISNRKATLHPCKVIFYNYEKKRVSLNILNFFEKFCNERGTLINDAFDSNEFFKEVNIIKSNLDKKLHSKSEISIKDLQETVHESLMKMKSESYKILQKLSSKYSYQYSTSDILSEDISDSALNFMLDMFSFTPRKTFYDIGEDLTIGKSEYEDKSNGTREDVLKSSMIAENKYVLASSKYEIGSEYKIEDEIKSKEFIENKRMSKKSVRISQLKDEKKLDNRKDTRAPKITEQKFAEKRDARMFKVKDEKPAERRDIGMFKVKDEKTSERRDARMPKVKHEQTLAERRDARKFKPKDEPKLIEKKDKSTFKSLQRTSRTKKRPENRLKNLAISKLEDRGLKIETERISRIKTKQTDHKKDKFKKETKIEKQLANEDVIKKKHKTKIKKSEFKLKKDEMKKGKPKLTWDINATQAMTRLKKDESKIIEMKKEQQIQRNLNIKRKRRHVLGDKISKEDKKALFSISSIMDELNFGRMLLPYCILINGQLYYKFDESRTFYKVTYSSV